MGSRQFDFHNGCVASQAAASGSERGPRERTQRTDADGVVVFLLRLRLRRLFLLLRPATYFVRISPSEKERKGERRCLLLHSELLIRRLRLLSAASLWEFKEVQ